MLYTHIVLALLGFPLASLLNLVADGQLDNPPTQRLGRHRGGRMVLIALLPLLHVLVTNRWDLALVYTLLIVLYMIVQTDLAEMIIPDFLVFTGFAVALALRTVVHPLPFWNYIVAAFAGSGFLLIVGVLAGRIMRKEALGGGDVKLYVFIGIVLGIKLTLLSIFVASLVGLILALIQSVLKRGSQGGPLPFGPSIAIAAMMCFLWGDRLINWYSELLQQ